MLASSLVLTGSPWISNNYWALSQWEAGSPDCKVNWNVTLPAGKQTDGLPMHLHNLLADAQSRPVPFPDVCALSAL